jgi:hypothetical protein
MTVSFANDVAPLFTARDITCMSRRGVNLSDYAYMSDAGGDATYADHANARDVYAHLTGDAPPRMPLGAPAWADAQLDIFKQWMADGFLA